MNVLGYEIELIICEKSTCQLPSTLQTGCDMLSARQWEGHGPRAGTARLNYLDEEVGIDDAEAALDEAAPAITEYAQGIPDRYVQ